jgi:hypothetical protein
MTHQENAPLSVTPGSIRFNTDSMKLEYYRGGPVGFGTTTTTGEWVNITTDSPDIQTGGTRGLLAGGNAAAPVGDRIDVINIATTGNATDFGNLTKRRQESGGFSNTTRALWAGDSVPLSDNTIDVLEIQSTGNATDFGDLLAATNNAQNLAGGANATRGVFAGAYQAVTGRVDVMQYVTIASNGDTFDFGNLDTNRSGCGGGSGSSTRHIWMGGAAPGNTNTMQFITMSTLGNAADFGDLTFTDHSGSGSSNAVRGIYFVGQEGANSTRTINYVSISTLGDAIDFGDLSVNHYSGASPSSKTRACYGGGGFPSTTDVIEYVQIMSTGDAIDFGDLTADRNLMMRGNYSNGHGGL